MVSRTATSSSSSRGALEHAHRHRRQVSPNDSPYTIARAPSPPIRYELTTDIRRNQRFGIKHKHGTPPPPSTTPIVRHQRGRSPTKRTPPSRNSTMTATSSGGFEEPSDLTGDERVAAVNDNAAVDYDDDDNMSLISMTNLIADDVCRLQNFRFENIGPDITQYETSAAAAKPNNKNNNHSPIIDMNLSFIDSGCSDRNRHNKTNAQRNQAPNSSKPFPPTVWDNPPRLVTGYETPDTGSMTSGSPRDRRASRMEVQVIDESDNISEITPTGCVKFEGRRNKEHQKSQRGTAHSHQSNSSNNNVELSPEDHFRELLVSMAACLPTSGDFQHLQRSFSDAQAKFDTVDKQSMIFGVQGEHQNIWDDPNYCERNRSFDGITGRYINARSANHSHIHHNLRNSSSYHNSNIIQHGRDILAPGSVASAPINPTFMSNSERYNQLVNGREFQTNMENRQGRKSWFKSKREVNKRRNNTKIVEQQQQPPQGESAVHAPVDEIHGNTSVEVVWKQSKSFKEHKKILTARGSVEALPTPSSKQFHSRTQILKKLLGRGKSKEPKRQKEEKTVEKETRTPAVPHPVSITVKDPTSRQQERMKSSQTNTCNEKHILGVSECVSSTGMTTGNLAIDICNSDIAMGLVGAPPEATRSKARGVSPGDNVPSSKNKGAANHDSAVTRTIITPSRKSNGPVWRGDKDSDFHPRWPKLDSPGDPKASSSPPKEIAHPRKSRSRCYHRNSEPIDLEDNDSGPTMSWTQSRSYEEDDFGQEDIKVVSIIGHHVSSSELERHASSFKPNGDATNSRMSDRHQKVFAQASKRKMKDSKSRRGASSKFSDRSSPTSYSPSSTSMSSSESSYMSSSSSSRRRPSRGTQKSRRLPPPGMSPSDVDALRYLSDNDKHAEFAAAFGAMETDDEHSSTEAVESPWRKDYKVHMASQNGKSNPQRSPRGPMTPPKIQRSSSFDDSFNAAHIQKQRSLPQQRVTMLV